jgi:hypothetical protein
MRTAHGAFRGGAIVKKRTPHPPALPAPPKPRPQNHPRPQYHPRVFAVFFWGFCSRGGFVVLRLCGRTPVIVLPLPAAGGAEGSYDGLPPLWAATCPDSNVARRARSSGERAASVAKMPSTVTAPDFAALDCGDCCKSFSGKWLTPLVSSPLGYSLRASGNPEVLFFSALPPFSPLRLPVFHRSSYRILYRIRPLDVSD